MFANAAIQGAAGFYKTFNTPQKAKRATLLMVAAPAFMFVMYIVLMNRLGYLHENLVSDIAVLTLKGLAEIHIEMDQCLRVSGCSHLLS